MKYRSKKEDCFRYSPGREDQGQPCGKEERDGMVELLAPAGSYESIKAAYQAGADAVYAGGGRFGARAYAQNLGGEELLEAIDYSHLRGKKLYLTVNTLLKDAELYGELYDYLLPLYLRGLDAVIVQDLGVMAWLRENFPGLPLHVSTQATVTGPRGARLLEELGARRVVPARELSLEEIRQIRRETGLEIETFIHGALCYSYSGQCLFSSMLGGRSGNRGRCAQPCRLSYQLYQEGRRLSRRGQEYLLSPKDICTVDLLPEILEAGVVSLKIEGRMKRAEYTAGVVRIYRKYLDLCLEGRPARLSPEDRAQLMLLFNRDGFSQGYYKVRNGRDMIALTNAKEKEREERETAGRREELYRELQAACIGKKEQEKIKGSLKLFPGSPAILELYSGKTRVRVEGEQVQAAQNQPLKKERVLEQLSKTGGTPFAFEELEACLDGAVFLPLQAVNQLRRRGLEELEKALLLKWRREALPRKPEELRLGRQEQAGEGTKEGAEGRSGGAPRYYGAAETAEQLQVLIETPGLEGIYAGCGCFDRDRFLPEAEQYLLKAKEKGKKFFLALPHMVRRGDLEWLQPAAEELRRRGLDGFLARSLEEWGFLRELGLGDRTVLDASVYTFNGEGQRLAYGLGALRDTAPAELNCRELKKRDNSRSELVVYGYQPLMVSAQCLAKTVRGCDGGSGIYQLKDRYGKEFCVKCHCGFCYNVIYNSVPCDLSTELQAVKGLGAAVLRLSFTREGREETRAVLERFLSGKPAARQAEGSYTKGHFRRGVE